MAWALPLRHMIDADSAALTSVSASRMGYCADVYADFCGEGSISASSPMSVGSMSPSAAASIAPFNATSDSGQQTAVVMAGRDLQRSRNLWKT